MLPILAFKNFGVLFPKHSLWYSVIARIDNGTPLVISLVLPWYSVFGNWYQRRLMHFYPNLPWTTINNNSADASSKCTCTLNSPTGDTACPVYVLAFTSSVYASYRTKCSVYIFTLEIGAPVSNAIWTDFSQQQVQWQRASRWSYCNINIFLRGLGKIAHTKFIQKCLFLQSKNTFRLWITHKVWSRKKQINMETSTLS